MTQKEYENPEQTPFDGLLKNLADHFAPELMEYLSEIKDVKECQPVGGEVELLHRLTDRVWKVTQEQEVKQSNSSSI